MPLFLVYESFLIKLQQTLSLFCGIGSFRDKLSQFNNNVASQSQVLSNQFNRNTAGV